MAGAQSALTANGRSKAGPAANAMLDALAVAREEGAVQTVAA